MLTSAGRADIFTARYRDASIPHAPVTEEPETEEPEEKPGEEEPVEEGPEEEGPEEEPEGPGETPIGRSGPSEGPADFVLDPNYPNPFNPNTVIPFGIDTPSHVRLTVYDVTGREIRRLVDRALPPGRHQATWDGRDDAGHRVPSGLYLYRLETGSQSVTRRMTLVK